MAIFASINSIKLMPTMMMPRFHCVLMSSASGVLTFYEPGSVAIISLSKFAVNIMPSVQMMIPATTR